MRTERRDWRELPAIVRFDVAPGALPHEPWRPHELSAALEAVAACALQLTPSPIGGLPTLTEQMAAATHWAVTTGTIAVPV
jgi:hypothetical protein